MTSETQLLLKNSMGLKELNFKSVYFSDEDNLLTDFYLQALSPSVKYDRIAGYLCFNALAIAANGLSYRSIDKGLRKILATITNSRLHPTGF